MQVVAFVAGLVLMLTPSFCAEKANFTCYSLTSLEAENVERVYDDNQDSGVFWSRSASGLDLCDFSSIYSTPQCSVCNDSGTIIVVLYNLTISVKLMVEGPERHISYKEIDCPRAETDDDKPGEERWIGIWVSVAFIAALLLLFIIFIIIKWMRERRESRMI
ncbi:uncharacterized protein LOC110367774 [Fundulus heteroclitus]|uniref:uncharacterized protein LOC110367774 n=1 Tax=Fundulus heteroclitus TaxID=8078 RepID=UPI00165A8710|nr:uncharacterized protein LOC110367774 [Fundulus heteroclitus]